MSLQFVRLVFTLALLVPLQAGAQQIMVGGTEEFAPIAIGALPTCDASILGKQRNVNDGTAYGTGAYGSAVSATGAVTRSVICTNTAGPTTYAWAYN
jgi:hypothetical protein